MASKNTKIEEELLNLTEMADEIYEYLEAKGDVPEHIAMRECPSLFMVAMFNAAGEDEKTEFISKRVMEKMKEKNDKRDRE